MHRCKTRNTGAESEIPAMNEGYLRRMRNTYKRTHACILLRMPLSAAAVAVIASFSPACPPSPWHCRWQVLQQACSVVCKYEPCQYNARKDGPSDGRAGCFPLSLVQVGKQA